MSRTPRVDRLLRVVLVLAMAFPPLQPLAWAAPAPADSRLLTGVALAQAPRGDYFPTSQAVTTPDLRPTALTAPVAITATRPQPRVQVSWVVQNQGTGEAQPTWCDGVYFSTDDVWDSQGRSLGVFCWSQAVAVGASYAQTQTVTLPTVATGSYYLILRTDYGGNLYESIEWNNEIQHAIAISVPQSTNSPWRTLDSN